MDVEWTNFNIRAVRSCPHILDNVLKWRNAKLVLLIGSLVDMYEEEEEECFI